MRKAAISGGRIVVHDPGTPGPRGLPAIIGVVEATETPEQVRERCCDRENMCARRRSHERYAAKVAETKATEAGREVDDETEESAEALFKYAKEVIGEPVQPSQERLL